MTVKQLLANLDAGEILEWQAFFKLEEERRENKQTSDVVSENLKIALGV